MPLTTVDPVDLTGTKPRTLAEDRVRIVVIENSPYDTRLIREAFDLWSRPYDLSCYSEASPAIEALRQVIPSTHGKTLVLLDWNLPGTHGSNALKQLREDLRLPGLYLVVFTSSSSEADRNLAKNLGADQFVTKAVDLDDFFYSLVSLQSAV